MKVRYISPNCNLRDLQTFRGLRKLRDHEEEIDDAAMVQNAEHIINTSCLAFGAVTLVRIQEILSTHVTRS